jgi:hypothetical protein
MSYQWPAMLYPQPVPQLQIWPVQPAPNDPTAHPTLSTLSNVIWKPAPPQPLITTYKNSFVTQREIWDYFRILTGAVVAPNTTITAASNGQVLPQATINVASTVNFPVAGILRITTSAGVQTVYYTGLTPTSFTGCAGGTGTMSTGGTVTVLATLPGTNTTIDVASNGQVLPQATINVASTVGFPYSGTIYVVTSAGVQIVNYTQTTPTTFDFCTGGTGAMSTGGFVIAATP